MGAARENAKQVFRSDNGNDKALQGAVNGGDKQHAAWRQAGRGSGQKCRHVAHVFYDLKREHHVKMLLR